MQREAVVNGYLFARMDVAKREEEYVTTHAGHERVRFARVIDVVRSIPASTSVQTPSFVDSADAQ
jgi:hypothetical protein